MARPSGSRNGIRTLWRPCYETSVLFLPSDFVGLMNLHHPWNASLFEVDFTFDILSVDKKGSVKTARRIEQGDSWDAILHLGIVRAV